MAKIPKTTNVYASTQDGLSDILGAAIDDEPAPIARAGELVETAQRAGPLNPIRDAADDSLAGSGGPDDGYGHLPATTPREAAENMLTLGFALMPAGDWQPDDEAEREELIKAVERVFAYRGVAPALPPELALIAVVGKFTRKRMAKPAVKAKLSPWLAKMPLLGKLMGAAPADEPVGAPLLAELPRMTPPHDSR